jgi:hypothetical protein
MWRRLIVEIAVGESYSAVAIVVFIFQPINNDYLELIHFIQVFLENLKLFSTNYHVLLHGLIFLLLILVIFKKFCSPIAVLHA